MSIIATYIVPHPPLIIPNIGRGDEKKIQSTIDAYHKIAKEISAIKPDTIIISSPHAISYSDYFHVSSAKSMHGDFEAFGAYDVRYNAKCDTDLVNQIVKRASSLDFPMGTIGSRNGKLDHGVSVPLYFVNKYYDSYKLVVVSPSGLSSVNHYDAGKIIHSVIPEEKKVVWIASGDMSHKLRYDGPYGFEPQGPIFDKEIVQALGEGQFLTLLELNRIHCQKVAECGIGSFTMMAGALDGLQVKAETLSYEAPFGVGYTIIKYTDFEANTNRRFDAIYESKKHSSIKELRETEDPYIKLARESLEYYIKHNKKIKTSKNLDKKLLTNRAGIFVSLHMNDNLRGCVGTVIPTKANIAEEIIDNAISAGTKDYRFPVVKENELNKLIYKVDELLPLEQIDSKDKLDIIKYGVVVTKGHKTGLLLPNIEGIDSIDEQIAIAKQKAGIKDYEDCSLHRFEVIRHQ